MQAVTLSSVLVFVPVNKDASPYATCSRVGTQLAMTMAKETTKA